MTYSQTMALADWTWEQENTESTLGLSKNILSIILKEANFLRSPQHEEQILNSIHFDKIHEAVTNNSTIKMILPAFPAKSSNPEKTSGCLPDMGEVVGLKLLNRICKKIQSIYNPGAKMIICSDGRVFSDLVLVDDVDVTAYGQSICSIIEEFQLSHLSTFNLEDIFDCESFSAMRDLLVEKFAQPIDEIRSDIKSCEKERFMFNGIHRFILEDQKVIGPKTSKNQLSLRSKRIAYQVIQRSHAWSQLVEEVFPKAVRLSIHPQVKTSKKLGICLVPSPNQWRTPWHSVALYDGNSFSLVKKEEAIEMGAQLKKLNNTYSYYQVDL